jgi:hypothetical protein
VSSFFFIKTGCNFRPLESCSIVDNAPVVGQIVAALFDCFVFGHKRIVGYIPTNLSNPSGPTAKVSECCI